LSVSAVFGLMGSGGGELTRFFANMKPDHSRDRKEPAPFRVRKIWWADLQRHPMHVELGKVLKEEREKRELTHDELCAAAKISKSHLCELEKGERSVSVEILLRIEWALCLSPLYLLQEAHRRWSEKQ
jgi:plasmid maintenance system antidote protein VapI